LLLVNSNKSISRLSSVMRNEQEILQTTLCGFPQLFAGWLSEQLSEKTTIHINACIREFVANQSTILHDTSVVVLYMNHQSQLSQVKQIRSLEFPVLVWWTDNTLNDEQMIALVNAGAYGILGTHHQLEDMIEAIHHVKKEGVYLNDLLSQGLLHYCRKQNIIQGSRQENHPAFSEREKVIIELRRQGNTSKEIAEQMCLSKKTIDKHFSDLYRKFNKNNFFDLLNVYEHSKSLSFHTG
ncbi:MAG TPA: LuxR C-terminal-related transcriptional regulator, partial [Bacteroidia bacterium]|nr:LuxR C-terminal-related transcriptional regulator [Bacteroidia bacterium]